MSSQSIYYVNASAPTRRAWSIPPGSEALPSTSPAFATDYPIAKLIELLAYLASTRVRNGLSHRQADRVACLFGIHPAEVWQTWAMNSYELAVQDIASRLEALEELPELITTGKYETVARYAASAAAAHGHMVPADEIPKNNERQKDEDESTDPPTPDASS